MIDGFNFEKKKHKKNILQPNDVISSFDHLC